MLGAGNRGAEVYGKFAQNFPRELKFVAVAEEQATRRRRFAGQHAIAEDAVFSNWADALEWTQTLEEKPAVFVCLPDRLHEEVGVACLELGLDVMLEKPVANTLAGTFKVLNAAQESNGVTMLGYVLRHTPFFTKVKELISAGALGEIVNIEWRENVSAIHFSHSYVRGNWNREDTSSPLILAKCSHDLDLLGWLTDLEILQVSSFGGLKYFRLEGAPQNAPKFCLDGCEHASECNFHVDKIYSGENLQWLVKAVSDDPSSRSLRQILAEGRYGRCVFHCDNTTIDNQVVAFSLSNGASGTFSVTGHSAEEGRSIRIDGTKATLRGVFKSSLQEIEIEQHDYATAFSGGGEIVPLVAPSGMAGAGHGGGDVGLTHAFIQAVRERDRQNPEEYLASHVVAFAIEEARATNQVVKIKVK